MNWMFAGYLSAFYVTIAVHAASTIHNHPRPMYGLAAYFILIPTLILTLSAEAVIYAPERWKTKIQAALRRGSLKHRYAFLAGFVTGVGVLVCFAISYVLYDLTDEYISEPHITRVFWAVVAVLMFVLMMAPLGSGWWLAREATRRDAVVSP